MNIKKIIREEIDGYKSSNEEDWEWFEGDVNIKNDRNTISDELEELFNEFITLPSQEKQSSISLITGLSSIGSWATIELIDGSIIDVQRATYPPIIKYYNNFKEFSEYNRNAPTDMESFIRINRDNISEKYLNDENILLSVQSVIPTAKTIVIGKN